MGYKITIDGPSGTGKGTLAKALAKKLNILNIDSGSLYRSFGLYAIRNNIDIKDLDKVHEALNNVNIELKVDNGTNELKPYLNGEDVTNYIRTEEVAKITSALASIKKVREYMVLRQHAVAKDRNIVMEGRDIGSVVFPDADLKIFLSADIEERARRRYNEITNKGGAAIYDEILEIMQNRDKQDSTRTVSPLTKTKDMIEIDTTNMSIEEVVDRAMELVKMKGLV